MTEAQNLKCREFFAMGWEPWRVEKAMGFEPGDVYDLFLAWHAGGNAEAEKMFTKSVRKDWSDAARQAALESRQAAAEHRASAEKEAGRGHTEAAGAHLQAAQAHYTAAASQERGDDDRWENSLRAWQKSGDAHLAAMQGNVAHKTVVLARAKAYDCIRKLLQRGYTAEQLAVYRITANTISLAKRAAPDARAEAVTVRDRRRRRLGTGF